MRIRTIKPEFWQSETMASIPKDSRLLAIALLNYADDEGFFFAIPQVIQGALFPFDEDSTSIRRGLDDLSRIGFCTSGTTDTGKKVCRIANFLEHQRIDRPQPSKIAGLEVVWSEFDECSTNVRRVLDDGREREGKGSGMEKEVEQGKGKGKAASPRFVPPTEDEWVAYCTETWPEWHPTSAGNSYAHYQGAGWKTKAGPVKDWKATARTAHGKAVEWGTLQPKAAPIPAPTLDEWIEEGKRLNREARNGTPEWSWEACEAVWHDNQAKGWRFTQDWRAAILAAYNRFLGMERQFADRRR